MRGFANPKQSPNQDVCVCKHTQLHTTFCLWRLLQHALAASQRQLLWGLPMKLSVIVVTHQSEKEIGRCLSSVFKTREKTPFEIIVVDAGSVDDTKSVIQQSCSAARYFQLRNVGFAAAANFGALKATGDILFFLNPDTTLAEGALEKIEKSFERKDLKIVGAFLRDNSGVPERWQAIDFPSLKDVILSHFNNEQKEPKSGTIECNWVSGGALAVKKEVFDILEGFSEKFFMYFEDVDFCRRAKNLGYRTFLNYDADVFHAGGRSAEEEKRLTAYDNSQSRYFFAHRNYHEYLLLSVLRPIFRHFSAFILVACLIVLSVLATLFSGERMFLASTLGIAIVVFVSRWPNFGIYSLLLSIIIGQTTKLPIGGVYITTTDMLLPLVLSGLFFAIVIRGHVKKFVRRTFRFWWFFAAFLPGIIFAFDRLPLQDFIIALSYFLRLVAVLCLIPLWQVLKLRYKTVKIALIITAVALAILGFLQLVFLPILPPTSNNIFVQLFLGRSGGGWDPHRYRLFATWLDPNFLGEFFVMMLSLLLAGKIVANTKKRMSFLAVSCALIIFTALVLTQSRSSFLAFFVVCGAYFVFGKIKRFIFPLATAILAALLIFPVFAGRIFVAPLSDPTVQLRITSWLQAWEQFKKFFLFGSGYNAYGIEQLASGNVNNVGLHSLAGADNFFLLLLATMGIWGFCITAFAVTRFFGRLIVLVRARSEVGLAIFLVFVSLLVHGQFVQSVTYIHLLLPLSILIASLPIKNNRKEIPR